MLIQVLVSARKENGLTQQDVAERVGKPHSYIANIEGCEQRFDVIEFIALARALNIDPLALFKRAVEAIAVLFMVRSNLEIRREQRPRSDGLPPPRWQLGEQAE